MLSAGTSLPDAMDRQYDSHQMERAMMWPWQEEGPEHLPPLRHWLLAAMLILGAMLAVPIFAALT